MFLCIALLLLLVSFPTSAKKWEDPPEKYIFLALGVSKAAYHSLPRPGTTLENQSIKDSAGREVCNPATPKWKVSWTGHKHDTEVILFENEAFKLAVFGFRGTELTNPRDWELNFKINLVEAKIRNENFKLHQGFRYRFRNIRHWFQSKCKALKKNKFKIILTGHSLGGAMATIAAAHATGYIVNYRPFAVITFASPVVGDEDFTKYYRKHVGCDRTIRFVVQGDIIPALSTPSYQHVCDAMKIMGGSNFNHHSINEAYEKALQNKYRRGVRFVSYLCPQHNI